MDNDYAAAVAAYHDRRDALRAEARAAEAAYRAEVDALDAAAERARRDRDTAAADAEAADALAAETDERVAVLWRTLGGFVGARRAGPTPFAARVPAGADAAAVRARVARAERLLSLARRGELPIEAPRHTEFTAAGIGAAVAALAVAAAVWLLSADGLAEGLSHALAAVALFAGVGAGPLLLGVWLSWQYRVRPRPGQLIACVAAGLAVACALGAVLLRGL